MKKRKTYEISVIDKTYSKIISDETKFYTSDTALELAFELKETEYSFESAEIVLLNVDDRSLATRPVSKVNNNFVYEIDDDVTSHYGDWRGQLMLVENGEVHVSSPIKFRIENDLYSNKPLEITEVVSWVNLKRYADSLVDELKQAVLSVGGIEDTFNENETIRQSTFEANETTRQAQELEREKAESQRQTVFDGNEAIRTETFNANEATRKANEDDRELAEDERSEKYDNYAQQFNDVITELSSEKDYHSLPEIAGARGGHDTLGARLDETAAQLAQTPNKAEVKSFNSLPESLTLSGGSGEIKPFISFVDDDGRSACYDTLYSLFESKGIVGTSAVTVSQIGSSSIFMTKDNLLELQDNGWEIASHNYDEVYFNSDNLTIEEIDYQARKSKEVLSDWGLAVNNYVYTGGQWGNQGQSETIRIIKKYYRSAYNTDSLQNKSINNYHWINRVSGDGGTLSSLKAKVDRCLAENNWLVFMLHSATHNAERTQIISDLIDYIKSKNIGIGTLNDGLDIFGSSFNIGSKETITVRNNGEIHGTGIGSVFRHPDNGYDIDENTPLYNFEPNKVTYSYIRTANNIEMPSPVNEGVLTTYHLGVLGAASSYQTWVQYNRETVYKRKWNGTYTTGQWGEWQTDTINVITTGTVFGPYETKVLDVDISKAGGGLTNQTPIVATCRSASIDNFSYNIRIASPTTAKLRITNLTDNPSGNELIFSASDWDIKVFRK